MIQGFYSWLITLVIAMALILSAQSASAFERTPQKPAIVLAAFGTSEIEALPAILNIRDKVRAAFPSYDVHLAFTSNIIRTIWHRRAADAEFKQENPNIPAEIYTIGNTLTTLAGIQEKGARLVLVQSLHITDGEEYTDLANLVKALQGYKTVKLMLHPFPWIGVGAPALGVGDGPTAELERATQSLADVAAKAKASGSALVLMGHGNEHLTQAVYGKFEALLRKKYGPQVYIGTVEAHPFAEDVAAAIKKSKNVPKSVLLVPMMVVAGDHARNDMAGDKPNSWASIFKKQGFAVTIHMEGLGSNDSWAGIYIEHLHALELKVVQQQKRDESAKVKQKKIDGPQNRDGQLRWKPIRAFTLKQRIFSRQGLFPCIAEVMHPFFVAESL